MTRYTTSRPDNWISPRQRRHADFGHGPIRSLIDDGRKIGEPHPLIGALILSAFAFIAMLFVVAIGG